MAKDLVNNPETKLGGAEKPYMDLGDHLEYIESLLEQGAGGAGGKSVPPTLNLFDLDGNDSVVRTTITEEEKTNLENGLYNQIIFPGPIFDGFQLYMPSKLIGDASFGVHSFAQFSYVASGDTITINALSLYSYSFGAKDTNGNYPITVEKSMDIPIGGNSGGGNIWYDLTSLNGNSITQEQYNEIKSLIDGNRLAGIKTVLQFFPLVSENNGEFKFAIFSKGYEQIDSNKKLEIDNIYFTIKPDLSITNTWDTTPVVELTKNLSSQSIPSIKTDGYQQNLTIGDGLIIENGTLKATGGGGGGGIKTVSVNLETMTWDTSQVDITKDKTIYIEQLGFVADLYNNSGSYYYHVSAVDIADGFLHADMANLKLNSDGTIKRSVLMISALDDAIVFDTGGELNKEFLGCPELPTGASTKNYTLNSVNGTLTWNTIGDGLTIENGVLKTTGGSGGNVTVTFED